MLFFFLRAPFGQYGPVAAIWALSVYRSRLAPWTRGESNHGKLSALRPLGHVRYIWMLRIRSHLFQWSTNIWETWPVIEGHNFKEDWDKEGHINHPKRSETALTTDDIHQLQQDTPAHNELRAPMNQFMERQFAKQEPLRNNLLIPTLEVRINKAAKLRGDFAQMVHTISRNFTIRDTNQIMEQLILRCQGDLNSEWSAYAQPLYGKCGFPWPHYAWHNAVSRALGDFAYLSGLTGLRLSCPHAVDTPAPPVAAPSPDPLNFLFKKKKREEGFLRSRGGAVGVLAGWFCCLRFCFGCLVRYSAQSGLPWRRWAMTPGSSGTRLSSLC